MDYLQVAIKASLESGKILRKHFKRGVKPLNKSDGSPVTIADKESEKKIVSIIRAHFPDHNILGEEFTYEKTDSEFKWIIDPLDMTKNFFRGVPFYSNLIALEKKGKVISGVINLPEINMLAYATIGKGAFVNGKRAHVSKTKALDQSFIVFGDIDKHATAPYTRGTFDLIDMCRFNRGYGDALGYVLLAKGNVDIMLDRGKPWDVAPGKIIVEEAGGKFTDYSGNDTIYGKGPSIATNGILHNRALKLLK